MKEDREHVCPMEHAGMLESRIRRWVYNPRRIVAPYIQPGMTVMDFGCGPGVFTLEMAQRVGPSGRVIAVDLQEGMLEIIRRKIQGADVANRIVLHQCTSDAIGVKEKVDFALAFWVVHEVPSPQSLFRELQSILKPNGKVLIVEPPFRVSAEAFGAMLQTAEAAGFVSIDRPNVFLCQAGVLKNK